MRLKAIELEKKGIKVIWFGKYQLRFKSWSLKEWQELRFHNKYWAYHIWSVSLNNKPIYHKWEIMILGFGIGFVKF